MLEQAAAAQWGVPLAEVAASKHEVVHRSTNRKLGYGALAMAASRLPVPARDKLRLIHESMQSALAGKNLDVSADAAPE